MCDPSHSSAAPVLAVCPGGVWSLRSSRETCGVLRRPAFSSSLRARSGSPGRSPPRACVPRSSAGLRRANSSRLPNLQDASGRPF
jgi:hypothetical protein